MGQQPPCSQAHQAMLYLVELILLLLVLPSSAYGIISLTPSEAVVDHGQYAEFTCTFNCDPGYIRTIVWIIGHPAKILLKDTAADFTNSQGIHVQIDSMSSCDHPIREHSERIRINATKPDHLNRTAVQCFVFGSADGRRLYSRYSTMIIKSAHKDQPKSVHAVPTPSPTNSPSVHSQQQQQQQQACPTPVPITTTIWMPNPSPVTCVQILTVTKEIKPTPVSTPLPEPVLIKKRSKKQPQ